MCEVMSMWVVPRKRGHCPTWGLSPPSAATWDQLEKLVRSVEECKWLLYINRHVSKFRVSKAPKMRNWSMIDQWFWGPVLQNVPRGSFFPLNGVLYPAAWAESNVSKHAQECKETCKFILHGKAGGQQWSFPKASWTKTAFFRLSTWAKTNKLLPNLHLMSSVLQWRLGKQRSQESCVPHAWRDTVMSLNHYQIQ